MRLLPRGSVGCTVGVYAILIFSSGKVTRGCIMTLGLWFKQVRHMALKRPDTFLRRIYFDI
jgi:hypothetical protein